MSLRVVEANNIGHKGETDSDVHISCGVHSGMETICGFVDTYLEWEDVDKPVTCVSCAEIYRKIKANKRKVKFNT